MKDRAADAMRNVFMKSGSSEKTDGYIQNCLHFDPMDNVCFCAGSFLSLLLLCAACCLFCFSAASRPSNKAKRITVVDLLTGDVLPLEVTSQLVTVYCHRANQSYR